MPPNRPLGAHDAVASGPGLSSRKPESFSQGSAFGLIEDLLAQYGLEGLLDTAKRWLQQGFSPDEIAIKLRGTDVFKARFPAIEAREKAGLSPLSPAEYVQFERTTRQLLREANLPQGFYDSTEDFTNLLVNDVSPAELDQRIKQGYQRVAQLNLEVRRQFSEWFGPEGDDALAAYFLDPEKALPLLERQVTMSEIGGAGKRMGANISGNLARRLYGVGVTGEQTTAALQELDQNRAQFNETVEEQDDYTIEDTGLTAKFGTDANNAEKLRRRQLSREAQFMGQGGAASGQEGFSGAGSQQSQ